MNKLVGILFLFWLSTGTSAQVKVQNNSFEGEPQDATVPVRWHQCDEETTPDILPGPWGVHLEAVDGETYMGLITRSLGTWEKVGQRLSKPLETGLCYKFSIELAHSDTYSGYNLPTKLVIYAGDTRCNRTQLIAEVPFVNHSDWKKYDFNFTCETDLNYIMIEANFMDGLGFPYKGNLLIDNISPFYPCKRAEIMVNKGIQLERL